MGTTPNAEHSTKIPKSTSINQDTANRINGLERPKPNEGYALKNDVSINIIDQNRSYVNL